MRRTVGAPLVQLVAGVLIIVAATTMPWSMYTSTVPKSTTGYHSGLLGVLLVLLGSVAIALALWSFVRPSRQIQQAQFAVGIAATVVSIVVALRKIHLANHFLAMGGGHTSYAIGAVVAVLASAAISIAGASALASFKREAFATHS
jgi:hypothetical protein